MVLQSHFRIHGEEYYAEAKSVRNQAEHALLMLGKVKVAPEPDPVRELAAASLCWPGPTHKKASRQRGIQPRVQPIGIRLMAGTESARSKLEGLQVLRGIAAILVLWCHVKYYLGPNTASFSNVPLLATDFGAIGVDIFFVLSGFVISLTAAKIANDWRTFLASRVARTVPLYFAITTLALLKAVISGDLEDRISIRSIFDSYAFIPLFDGRNFVGPFLINGWTLSFEMWFYLCLAALLRLGYAQRAWLLLPGFFALGMAVNMVLNESHWYLPKFLFHPMTLEFCAGCFLYHARNSIGKLAFWIMASLIPFFFYFAAHSSSLGLHLTILNDATAGLHRAIIWGGFAASLVGVISQIDLKYSWKWPAFLLLLGDASYSIYLIPAISMVPFTLGIVCLGKFTGHNLAPPPVLYGTVFVLGSIVAGIACWKFFEAPTTEQAKRFLFRFFPEKREIEGRFYRPQNPSLTDHQTGLK